MTKFIAISMLTTASVMLTACDSGPAKRSQDTVSIFKVSDQNPETLVPTGELKLTDLGDKGVRLELKVEGFEPGIRAMHLHEVGSCVGPDFKSAGGHFNPASVAHGQVEDGPHAGDMMNIEIKADGTGEFTVINPNVSLTGSDGLPTLRDADGTALIIHGGADDYKSQPTGAAGPRVACTIIPGG